MIQARQRKEDWLEGDSHAWGDMKAQFIPGLRILGYPDSTVEGRRIEESEGIFSRSGKLAQPWYWSDSRLQRMDSVIQQMPEPLIDVYLCRYAIKMAHQVAAKRLKCHPKTIENRLKEARDLLIASRYWES